MSLMIQASGQGGERADAGCRPDDRSRGIEDALQAYLRWEANLPDRIAPDGDARLRVTN